MSAKNTQQAKILADQLLPNQCRIDSNICHRGCTGLVEDFILVVAGKFPRVRE
jgi:hypothetical protein